MRRFGLISDTHGRFDPQLTRLFQGCEQLLHAGDVGGGEVLWALEAIAPVRAVRGNTDEARFDGFNLPDILCLELQAGQRSVKALLLHILGAPGHPSVEAAAAVSRQRPRILLFGHTHAPYAAMEGGTLLINAGSAGPRRNSLPRCAALLELAEEGEESGAISATVRHLDLDRGGAPLCEPEHFTLR